MAPKNTPPKRPGERGTITEKMARKRLLHQVEALYDDADFEYAIKDQIPGAWKHIEHELDVEERRVRVTLLLDESVAKFYRAMGKGYQRRINRILGTYAQMKIGKVTEFFQFTRDLGKEEQIPEDYKSTLREARPIPGLGAGAD